MEPEQNTSWFPNLIIVFIFSFAFGIFLSSFVSLTPLIAVLTLVVGLAVILGEKIYAREVSKEVLLLALVLISFGLGSLRYAVKDFHELVVPEETGEVVSEPEDKDNSRRFVFLSDNGEKVLVSAPLYSPVQYGDRVSVVGKLEQPGVIESETGGRDFDYGKYLAKDDIYHALSFAEIEILSSGHGNKIKSALFKIKRGFVAKAKEILAEPYASLLMGLIVAGRDAMPKDILEEFRRAGVIHIVVLSGFNITLIAEFLRRAFQTFFIYTRITSLPQAAAGASIVGVLLFVIMTGGEATVVRAAIMALTVIVAKLFGRNYSASRALLVAGFIMLLENPKILVFDPSFQLSFLATLGLIYLMPIVDRLLSRGFLSNWIQLRETLSQTLSTQIMVLPLLTYSMGDVSLVSLPANILILLIVPYTMLVGFLATLVAFASSILAWPLALISHLLLSWILFVSHILGSLSFATIQIPSLSIWVVVLMYLVLVGAIIFVRSRNFPQSSSS